MSLLSRFAQFFSSLGKRNNPGFEPTVSVEPPEESWLGKIDVEEAADVIYDAEMAATEAFASKQPKKIPTPPGSRNFALWDKYFKSFPEELKNGTGPGQ